MTAWAGSSRYARGHTRWYEENVGALVAVPVMPEEPPDSSASAG